MNEKNSEKKNLENHIEELRSLIDEADSSYAAGHGKSYDDPSELVKEIVKRGKEKLKPSSP